MLDGAAGRHHLRRLPAHNRVRADVVPAADQPDHAHALRPHRGRVHHGHGGWRPEEGGQGDCGRHQGAGGKAGAGRHVGHDGRHAAHAHGRRRRDPRRHVGRRRQQRAHHGHGRQRQRHLQRAGQRQRQRHAPPQPGDHGGQDAQRAQEAPRHHAQERTPSRRAQARRHHRGRVARGGRARLGQARLWEARRGARGVAGPGGGQRRECVYLKVWSLKIQTRYARRRTQHG